MSNESNTTIIAINNFLWCPVHLSRYIWQSIKKISPFILMHLHSSVHLYLFVRLWMHLFTQMHVFIFTNSLLNTPAKQTCTKSGTWDSSSRTFKFIFKALIMCMVHSPFNLPFIWKITSFLLQNECFFSSI